MALEYTYYSKNCTSGYPKYYGHFVDENGIEQSIQISATEYVAAGGATGCPSRFLQANDGSQYIPGTRRKRGLTLAQVQNIPAVVKLGFSKTDWQQIAKLEPYAPMFLAMLNNAKVPVSNENNLIEIVTKFAELTGAAKLAKDEKAGTIGGSPKTLDVGGLAGGILGIFDAIGNAVDQGNTQQYLQQFTQNYVNYMQTDFAVIDEKLQSEGPAAALSALRSYKNGSWAELNSFMEDWCAAKKISVPSSVKSWMQKQKDKEAELSSAANTYPAGNDKPSGGGGSVVPGGGGSTDGNKKTIIYIVVAFVALIVVAVLVYLLTKKRK